MNMLVPIVLWIVALIFILITLTNIIKRTIKKKRCTAVTEGTITDIKERIRRKEGVRSREYTPYVTYSVDGVEYNKKFIKAYIGDTYKIGQKLKLCTTRKSLSRLIKKD